ncbi:sulfatase-like hydrolase/transferase [Micrococcales bacterium 31B]|nr:sulfatase-like hydrolase/transferase [Micrococcales bacterium 31B]
MSTTTRPNILLIVSDDHGYADRSCLGIHPDVRTPGLDRLAAEGVWCREAYVTAPICSPSRAALITGAYPARWGVRWFGDSEIAGPEYPTVAEHLANAGYRTGYFGKVHYGSEGPDDRGAPPHHGFEESYYGLAGRQMGRLHYLHHSAAAVDEYGEAAQHMGVEPLYHNVTVSELEGFTTDEFARRTSEFITTPDDRPFFAMLAFNAVHNFCWQLPEAELEARGLPAFEDWHPEATPYVDWYDGAISPHLENGRAYYLAQLELMDRQIDGLLALLDERGLAENTLVIYLTDNGGSTCNYGDNAPLRGTKYSLFEGGIRVPFIVRWPGHVPADIERDGLVSSMDIAATLLKQAGVEVPSDGPGALDGHDLLEYLQGTDGPAHETLHWDCGFQWAVRSDDWKLMWVDGDDPAVKATEQVEHTNLGAGYRLTHIDHDLGEAVNLADARPDIVAALDAAHRAWQRETGLAASPDPAAAR